MDAAEILPPRRPFSIGEAFGLAWPAFKQFYGLILAVLVIYLVIEIAIAIGQAVVEKTLGIQGLLGVPLSIFVTAPLSAGLSYFGVRCVRGEPVRVEDLFWGFKRYWVIVGVQVLSMLIMAGLAIPAAIAFVAAGGFSGFRNGVAPTVLLILIGVATLLVAIALGLRFAFAQLTALDERCQPRPGVIDSLCLSWHMTASGNWAMVLILGLLLGLITIACALALLLPLLFLAFPLTIVVWGAAYHLMAEDSGIAIEPQAIGSP